MVDPRNRPPSRRDPRRSRPPARRNTTPVERDLSVVQLAAEVEVKYWVVAQKHPDLRDHFQRLAAQQRRADTEFRDNHDAFVLLQCEHFELKKHCAGLEELIRIYASVINELALENDVLRQQAATTHAAVRPLRTTRQDEA